MGEITAEEAAANRARLDMVHALHAAMYGDSWVRPQPPREVWEALLAEVSRGRPYEPLRLSGG